MEIYFIVAERGSSLIVQRFGMDGLFWIVQGDLPDNAMVLRFV
jgi:hypothetical protein